MPVCDCAAYNGTFRQHCFNYSECFPGDGTQTVLKYVGGDFAHLLCTHSSARKVGFISCFVVFLSLYLPHAAMPRRQRNEHCLLPKPRTSYFFSTAARDTSACLSQFMMRRRTSSEQLVVTGYETGDGTTFYHYDPRVISKFCSPTLSGITEYKRKHE